MRQFDDSVGAGALDWCVVVVAASMLMVCSASAQVTSWRMSDLAQNVAPLQHELKGRMPLLTQDLPEMPVNNDAMIMRRTGALRANVDTLWSRGIAPSVHLSTVGEIYGALATGVTLEEAHVPVNLMAYLSPTDFWPRNDSTWFRYQGVDYPAYPLATPDGGFGRLLPLLQRLRAGDAAAGLPGIVSVAGLWMDYEGHPWPWLDATPAAQLRGVLPNGRAVISYHGSATVAFPGNRKSVLQAYGSNLFDGGPIPPRFEQYTFDLRTWLLEQSVRRALLQVYGTSKPWFGNFDEFFSSRSAPFYDQNGIAYPVDRSPAPGTAAMPAVYANNALLPRFGIGGGSGPPLNQTNIDDLYWQSMLNAFSSSARNAGATGKSVAWVSQYVRDNGSGTYDYPMTVSLYRELLRHLWLRGCMRMSVFNPHDYNADPTKWYMTPDYSFHQLEYARGVLDEMLAFRTFLDQGTPMNFAVNPMFDHGPVWSGLAVGGRAVVRAVSPNSARADTIAAIKVPGGATFIGLMAPPDGATYLLGPGPIRHRVDVRPAAVYLQMTENLADSSGNGRGGEISKTAPAYADPTFSADVPAASILQGAYGLYANQSNRYSLSLTRDAGSDHQANAVSIPNTNDVFNALSFTVETFVKVAAGGSQDAASLISKGISAEPGAADWTIRYRDFNGAGMVELTFFVNPSTRAWIRTAKAPLTPSVWHHLALTYEDAARRATVYVDGVAQPFGEHNAEISDTGILARNLVRHTDDQLVVGFFDRGINANFDEVRFTPEALDPKQLLTQGPLR